MKLGVCLQLPGELDQWKPGSPDGLYTFEVGMGFWHRRWILHEPRRAPMQRWFWQWDAEWRGWVPWVEFAPLHTWGLAMASGGRDIVLQIGPVTLGAYPDA